MKILLHLFLSDLQLNYYNDMEFAWFSINMYVCMYVCMYVAR